MKTGNRLLLQPALLCATILFFTGAARAGGNYSFGFTAEQTQQDANYDNGPDSLNITSHWSYKVTIENRSFKDLPGIEVKYIVFVKHETYGGADHARVIERKAGSKTVDVLKNAAKWTFNTDALEMHKLLMSLTESVHNTTKTLAPTNVKQKDSLNGIWLRIYQNGAQIGEYIYPEGLVQSQKWEGP
jgi:hypothetical protein